MKVNRGMHGLNKETHKHLLLDAGVVILNYGLGTSKGERKLGATMGGSTFTVERDIRLIDADGNKGKTENMRRVINENATLVANLFEITAENIALAIAGASVTTIPSAGTAGEAGYTPEMQKITSSDIIEGDWVDNVTLLTTISGTSTPVIITVRNVLSDENFELGMEDKNEATLPVTFSAHWSLDDDKENVVPWDIQYPTDIV